MPKFDGLGLIFLILQMQGVWENALVHIVRPEPIDPNGPCFNTKPSDDNAPVTFHPSSRSVTVVPPACLEVNKTYEIIIDLRRYQTVNESPAASILIDSIILIPRVDRLPIFSDPHITENRLDEYYRNCKYVDRGEVIKTQIPNICKKHHMSISFQFFNKAYRKYQNTPLGKPSAFCFSTLNCKIMPMEQLLKSKLSNPVTFLW